MKLDWKRTTQWTWNGTTANWAWYYTIQKDMTYSIYTVQFNLNGESQEIGSQYTLPEAKAMAKDHAAQRWAER